jgi:cell fate regulator YaaT (PSP1 superfamily)
LTQVISVRFRGGCKNYFFDPGELQVKMGDQVIVETAQGPEFATCTEGNHEVAESAIVKPLCAVVRMATEADRRTAAYNRKRESEAFDICEKKIADHKLEMKLVSVSCSFDGSKIVFFFTADGRVDFRELVRDLASVFRARIELRQIGVRDEAKMIGGLGICGRPFCCSQFLDGFMPVSIKMAKTQNLSLNPTKISGTCGRLMCCLKYEQNAYEDAAKRMPKPESFVQTPDGPGNVKSVDLLQEKAKVSLDSAPDPLKCYRGCELCVLRNGKGSRDGIDVPAERPARYVPEKTEEPPAPVPMVSTPFYMGGVDVAEEEPPVREKIGGPGTPEEKARRRRSRGRRRSGGAPRPEGEGAPAPQKAPEKAPDAAAPRPPRPPRTQPPAPPQAGQDGPAPRQETPADGEARRRRPHHRGGRRRGRGGSGSAPESPAGE